MISAMPAFAPRLLTAILFCAFLPPAQGETPMSLLTDLGPYAGRPMALVRNATANAPDRIDLLLLDAAGRQVVHRHPTTLRCQRVYLAHARIFCLGTPKAPGRGGPADFRVTGLALKDDFSGSVPSGVTVSRARVSADGIYAASTMFVTGHAYGADIFSTEAIIIDLRQHKLTLAPLEYWDIARDGKRLSPRDLNFWGVSFNPRNSDEFYVTAAYGGNAYLARGTIGGRRIELLRAGIECPSVSPDGSRIAFKKKTGPASWAPAVLDLASMTEHVFPQSHSVDDQIEWLDDHTLLYEVRAPRFAGVRSDLVSLDLHQPQAGAQLWLKDAASPAVARK